MTNLVKKTAQPFSLGKDYTNFDEFKNKHRRWITMNNF